MRNPLADKVVEIKPSGIRKFFDIVSEMKDAISPPTRDWWSCVRKFVIICREDRELHTIP